MEIVGEATGHQWHEQLMVMDDEGEGDDEDYNHWW